MYHIKDDKRSYKSAELICEGLSDILKKKEYSEINITEVCKQKGIARTTFYRLFDILDDVLMYQFDTLFKESICQYSSKLNSEKSFAKLMIEIAMSNKSLIIAIVNSGRTDLFNFSTRNNELKIITSMNLELKEKDIIYCTSILTQMAYAVFSTWIKTGAKENSKELYALMKRELKIIYQNI